MALHPQVQTLLLKMAALGGRPLTELTPEESRLRPRLPVGAEPVAFVQDKIIPGPGGQLPIRIYRPAGYGPFPVLVYYHGGGWVFNNLDTHDHVCRSLANAAACAVVSVDYRLAPEHKFPAAVEDAYAAVEWVATHAADFHGDPKRIAVGGDSAGGNLAAVVALLSRDRRGPDLSYQLLVYPVTDYGFDTPSYLENAVGYMLTRDSMVWFWNHYLSSADAGANPLASPLRASDLTGLPPAFVITAEYDPLRDEGEAYANRLKEAGVEVVLKRYPSMIHSFFAYAHYLDTGKEAIQDAAMRLQQAFAK